ncbi:hypothetical protein NHX12_005831, partial [Muraenolepis orangiensis]
NEPISYSLLINPSSLFSISGETGEISLTCSMDYEGDQHRYLLLKGLTGIANACDRSITTAYNVSLHISPDVNDNVLFFTLSIYEASVTDGAESGTLVFQVSAYNLDLGMNGK